MASCDLGMMVTSCRGMSFGGDSQGWAREVACVLSLSPTQVVPAEWHMGRESERCISCHAGARLYIFGSIWDEIDISRSHANAVFGCWEMAETTSPISLTRHRTEPEFLESDVARK